MKQLFKNRTSAVPYNENVQAAYFLILKQAKKMLSTIEQEELRFALEREDKSISQIGTIVHELVNPLIYLRLELHQDNKMAIHFGIEHLSQPGQLADLTTRFLRLLYKVTMNGAYPIDIERCIKTDWFINSCSALYEYVENSEYYTFKQIKYKVTAGKRKELLSVA